MYIALYEKDTLGRHILAGWEAFATQEFGDHVPGTINIFYSDFLSPRKISYTKTLYEITSVGLLPLTPEDFEQPTELQAAKDSKIALLNQQFEKLTEQIAPGGYLVYLYALSILQEVDTNDLFLWLRSVNMERDKLIEQIYTASDVGSLGDINATLGDLEFERPSLPLYDTGRTNYTFRRTASSTYDDEVSVDAGSEIELYMQTNKLPLHGMIIVGNSDHTTTQWTNHKDIVRRINPNSILFRLEDGSTLSAYGVLNSAVELPEGFTQLEFTVDSIFRLSNVNLTLADETNTATIETACGLIPLKGRRLNFEIDCSSITSIITTDSSTLGPLSIQGTELSTVDITHSASLDEGDLSLNMGVDNVDYEILNQDNIVLYNGNESVEGIMVGNGYTLKCHFMPSNTPITMSWTYTPREERQESYMVRTRYSKRQKKLTIINDNSIALKGQLVIIHRAKRV